MYNQCFRKSACLTSVYVQQNTSDDAATHEIMKNDQILLNNAGARLVLEEHLDMYIDYIHSQNIEFYICNDSQYSMLGLVRC